MTTHTVVLTLKDRATGERFDITYPRVEAPTSWQAIDVAVTQWRTTDADLDTAGVPGRGRYTLLGNRVVQRLPGERP